METVLQKVETNAEKINQLDEQLASVRDVLASQQCKLADFEDRSRRNNLTVFGVPEAFGETIEDLRAKVLTGIFEERLGVKVKTVERKFRLGKKREDKTRPVTLRFYDFKEKVTIYKNCSKLKGSDIPIAIDLSQATLQEQRKLWERTKAETARGAKVKLVRDRITVEKETFVWDDAKNCRVTFGKEGPESSDSA